MTNAKKTTPDILVIDGQPLYGLYPRFFKKTSQSCVDQDYVKKLISFYEVAEGDQKMHLQDALIYLAKFNSEYYYATGKSDLLDKSQARDACNASNARRRDIYTLKMAIGQMTFIDPLDHEHEFDEDATSPDRFKITAIYPPAISLVENTKEDE